MDSHDISEWYGRLLSFGVRFLSLFRLPRTVSAYWAVLFFRLLFATLGIAFLLWWGFTPRSGDRELRRSQQAWRSATSWRSVHSSDLSSQEEEVSCPSAARSTWKDQVAEGAQQGLISIKHNVDVGGKHYSMWRVFWPASGSWTSSGWEVTSGRVAVCAQRIPDWDHLVRTSIVTRGETEVVRGETCRVWKVRGALSSQRGVNDEQEICISEHDHLPRRINGVIYYDWNQPIAIAPPDVHVVNSAQ
jgi:hypothetical protein